jgi:hypothetical protein
MPKNLWIRSDQSGFVYVRPWTCITRCIDRESSVLLRYCRNPAQMCVFPFGQIICCSVFVGIVGLSGGVPLPFRHGSVDSVPEQGGTCVVDDLLSIPQTLVVAPNMMLVRVTYNQDRGVFMPNRYSWCYQPRRRSLSRVPTSKQIHDLPSGRSTIRQYGSPRGTVIGVATGFMRTLHSARAVCARDRGASLGSQ